MKVIMFKKMTYILLIIVLLFAQIGIVYAASSTQLKQQQK